MMFTKWWQQKMLMKNAEWNERLIEFLKQCCVAYQEPNETTEELIQLIREGNVNALKAYREKMYSRPGVLFRLDRILPIVALWAFWQIEDYQSGRILENGKPFPPAMWEDDVKEAISFISSDLSLRVAARHAGLEIKFGLPEKMGDRLLVVMRETLLG